MVRSKQERCEARVPLPDASRELAANAGRDSGWVEETRKYKLDEEGRLSLRGTLGTGGDCSTLKHIWATQSGDHSDLQVGKSSCWEVGLGPLDLSIFQEKPEIQIFFFSPIKHPDFQLSGKRF